MKARVPHPFIVYASQFTLDSMIHAICYWAKEIAHSPKQKNNYGFSAEQKYSITINKKTLNNKVQLIQTWLIDMLYYVICMNNYGEKYIQPNEALHLICLYNDFADTIEAKNIHYKKDIILYVLGFFGEQSRFQAASIFFEEFAREKHIMDVISYITPKEKTYGIDVKKEVQEEIDFSTDEYSAILLCLWGLFSKTSLIVNEAILKEKVKYNNPLFSTENLLNVISKNSINIEEIRRSTLGRQVFYTKPIIKIGENYIASNPYLLLSSFASSNYWIMRNKYHKKGSQDFINAFGYYFETYLDEVMDFCLPEDSYTRIPEDNNEKRADLHIKLGQFDLLVEQKSALSLLGIKQSHPDVASMKSHMIKNWSKAIKQLKCTQNYLQLKNPIKIVLVYEDYYKSKCLDELFLIDKKLTNDNKYWLLSISEFENLLYIYKINPELALRIIEEKDRIETTKSYNERDLKQLFYKYDIESNLYLKNSSIYNEQFEKIKNFCLSHEL